MKIKKTIYFKHKNKKNINNKKKENIAKQFIINR